MKKNQTVFISIFFIITLLITGCENDLKVIDDFGENQYLLLNQDSIVVQFPKIINGSIGVVGYIFTNCPDICPLTTNNMRLIQEKLKIEQIENVKFVSISFDPTVDKPSVLTKFAHARDLDLSNWTFLTGKEATIASLIKRVGVVAIVGDSTVFKDGSKTYYYVHTDRISLVDEDGLIRKNYSGSSINIDEIISDIKKFN